MKLEGRGLWTRFKEPVNSSCKFIHPCLLIVSRGPFINPVKHLLNYGELLIRVRHLGLTTYTQAYAAVAAAGSTVQFGKQHVN